MSARKPTMLPLAVLLVLGALLGPKASGAVLSEDGIAQAFTMLQRALALPTPAYMHLPLIVDPHGVKLSKSMAALPFF